VPPRCVSRRSATCSKLLWTLTHADSSSILGDTCDNDDSRDSNPGKASIQSSPHLGSWRCRPFADHPRLHAGRLALMHPGRPATSASCRAAMPRPGNLTRKPNDAAILVGYEPCATAVSASQQTRRTKSPCGSQLLLVHWPERSQHSKRRSFQHSIPDRWVLCLQQIPALDGSYSQARIGPHFA
jgi:hypothetical protein